MNVRRSAAALAATAVLATAAPAVAASPSPSPSTAVPDGLYGSADPTYDGVWRQSLTLLAQREQGVEPAATAVDWLVGQQCANGAFPAFRADPAQACDAKVMVDTNSTAVAAQALAGNDKAVSKALAWLRSVQNTDGGWGYTEGGASDANSTSVVIGAFRSAGRSVTEVEKDGHTPSDALLELALPCTGDGAGAFAYQPGKKGELTANADATAAAVLSAFGGQPGAVVPGADQASTSCAKPGDLTRAARNGAAYLVGAMGEDAHLMSALPGSEDQPDFGNTADAVVALSAAGFTSEAAASARWLAANSLEWAGQSGPAAYAQLVFAARAAGLDPRAFGGEDLIALLDATGPKPASVPAAKGTGAAGDKEKDKKEDEDGGGVGVWWIVGVGLVGGIGIGFLLSGRTRKRQP
ncbi:prenyltransferase/squalene oxidase repeat-containing protein [Streptomyces sp. NPDC090106]|uniref:prenyltransferase/squalene oxidase repeat-containing protein n=1 Tax=Streptomyces sp. NPDC090106 TaxID=3365946 RepID=UPI00382CBEB3